MNLANAVAGSIGDPTIYNALVTNDNFGDPGNLVTAIYDLMSYAPGRTP